MNGNEDMLTIYKDYVLLRSETHEDVTINAVTFYLYDESTDTFSVGGSLVGKFRDLGGLLDVQSLHDIPTESKAQEICKYFIVDKMHDVKMNPKKYHNVLRILEKTADQDIPDDVEDILVAVIAPKGTFEDNPTMFSQS